MSFEVRQLGRTFFAEIRGVALNGDTTDAEIAEFWDLFHQYAVLFFPGQNWDDDTQLGFSRKLGPLLRGSFRINRRERIDTTHLADLSNIDPDGGIRDPKSAKMGFLEGNKLWHTDSSFEEVPALMSLLSAREVPPSGGETEWADLRAAWDELPAAGKAGLEGLIAEHSLAHSRKLTGYEGFNQEERAAWPPVEQVLVRTHEATGRKNLYIGAHASRIVGRPVDESRALLKELMEFATRERFTYTHTWTVGDLVLWDNRCVVHRGRPWESTVYRRDMRRTTIVGNGATVQNGRPVDEVARYRQLRAA
jgi:alpha-ketoglutarate-dependent 2,4-dichlorophenoxyacetate dioxygenase